MSSTHNGISDQEFESYYKKLKSVLQEKVTFKVKSVGSSPEEDKVEVELKVKPLLLSELQPKLNKENEKLLKKIQESNSLNYLANRLVTLYLFCQKQKFQIKKK